MKKVIKPGVKEESEILCDVSGAPAVVSLCMSFGYGSPHDLSVLKADLSSEVAEEILGILQSKYPQLKLKEEGFFPACPMCERH